MQVDHNLQITRVPHSFLIDNFCGLIFKHLRTFESKCSIFFILGEKNFFDLLFDTFVTITINMSSESIWLC